MPRPHLYTRGVAFEVTLYLALHADARLNARAVSDWWGVERHAAENLLAKLAKAGLARRVAVGMYGPGEDLARTVRTLREPIPVTPTRPGPRPAKAVESAAQTVRMETSHA